jgi:hypothetical protein
LILPGLSFLSSATGSFGLRFGFEVYCFELHSINSHELGSKQVKPNAEIDEFTEYAFETAEKKYNLM